MFSAAASGPTDAEFKAEKPGALYLPLEKAPAELADAVEERTPEISKEPTWMTAQ